jgi:riboflavin synthase alpha subunit
MFTGLVEAVGEVAERTSADGGCRLRIATPLAGELSLGDSVAVNGVCLTVVAAEPGEIALDVGPETSRVTTLGALARGGLVNLERPLRADGRLGGHFVQGHVDAVGGVEDVRRDGEFHWLTVSFPARLSPFFIDKGAVAVDGISLTVASLQRDRFAVQLVPYTMEHTSLSRTRVGDRVNLECDMVGKYVARAAEVAWVDYWKEQP